MLATGGGGESSGHGLEGGADALEMPGPSSLLPLFVFVRMSLSFSPAPPPSLRPSEYPFLWIPLPDDPGCVVVAAALLDGPSRVIRSWP